MKNRIGLKEVENKAIAKKLNELLANYQVYYQNLRGFHWNIKGSDFFVLHEKFETLYHSAQSSIDDIAERILTLGEHPLHTYSDFLETARINEAKNVSSSKDTVENVLQNLEELIIIEREILELSSDSNDEGTASLMSDYLSDQEKTTWMFSSFLNQ